MPSGGALPEPCVVEREGPWLRQGRAFRLTRLLTYSNVVVTGHQAYLTREALADIAGASEASFDAWDQGHPAEHEL